MNACTVDKQSWNTSWQIQQIKFSAIASSASFVAFDDVAFDDVALDDVAFDDVAC